MTQRELSQLEVRINVRVLWAIVAAIAFGTFVITMTYADIKGEMKLIKYQIEELKNKK